MKSPGSATNDNMVTLLGWKGYNEVVRELKNVEPLEEDTYWLPENIHTDSWYKQTKAQVEECKDADEVVQRFEHDPKPPDFVVVDREYKDCDAYRDRLMSLGTLDIYSEKILSSALPLLAARHYYTAHRRVALLPIRFGTNGVVCNQKAIDLARTRGLIKRDVNSGPEKFCLRALYEMWASDSDRGAFEYCRWAWNAPVDRMISLAVKGNKAEEEVLKRDVFSRSCATWDAMKQVLSEDRPVVLLGPSEMLSAPFNSVAGKRVVDWFLVSGAELLWIESIGCYQSLTGKGTTKDVLERRSKWLSGTALRLMADPWQTVRKGDYWGYPVLGWSRASTSDSQREQAIIRLEEVVGPSRIRGLTKRTDPGQWMSDFLMSSGISLRDK